MNEEAPKGGRLRYKCRSCGEEFQCTHVPDVFRAVSAIVYGFPNPWPKGLPLPHLVDVHCHKDGFGVADLLGGSYDKETGG